MLGAWLLLCFFPATARAGESWADPKMPVRDGLELWLDVSRQNAARKPSNLPLVGDGRAVDVLFDGSGRGRHLAQRVAAHRPTFHQNRYGAWLAFDGVNDFLFAGNLGGSYTNATVVIYGAVREKAGGFRAFFAANETGRNDFETGLNLDLGPGENVLFLTLNAEGAGFGGAQNLMQGAADFGRFHRIYLECAGPTVALHLDGRPHKSRPRKPGAIQVDEFTLGARHYSLDNVPFTQGFLAGEIAEVLVFDRALSAEERAALDNYLSEKYARLSAPVKTALPPLLETVTNAPPVQMFIPGFAASRLPVAIKNINNIKYRADGKLVALGYNGQVHLLWDTDGDGLEDTVQPFWSSNTLRAPIGMALTPSGYPGGFGVFVAAKGKVVLLQDSDGDDRADKEIIVANGWNESILNVDTLGVAVDAQGHVYYGLGCSNFADPYMVRGNDRARYDINSERGTILKVAPDFSRREIVCTGIRFPVALAFNRHGDLFCSDQEGATWLPNGNPLDELLHIQPGRHYGFPPRHPAHLPNVIDEPSTFDYGPQHQSLCGFNFNESVNGGPVFGPSWWAGDALLTGESRGKLYRTKLVKSAVGYIGQNQIIGSVTNLLVDVCVSPRGELVATVHSGKPDWGTGPEGAGTLYKISYTNRELPQPVLVWAESPTRTRVAFDRPVGPSQLKNVLKSTAMVAGRFVSAGDRFEVIWPGYAVVHQEKVTPREEVPVFSAQLSPDGLNLTLETAPRREAIQYAVVLPGLGSANRTPNELPQHDAMDLQYDLCGVEAQWTSHPTGGRVEQRSAWLPHLDLAVAREFTDPIEAHREFFKRLQQPGELTLRTQLDLWQMLRPAVQLGSTLDYTLPPEEVTVVLSASSPFSIKAGNALHQSSPDANGLQLAKFKVTPMENEWLPVEITLPTGTTVPDLGAAFFTAEDDRRRPLQLRRFILPWATAKAVEALEKSIPEIEGGNWLAGRRHFFGEQMACAKCHRVDGQGGSLGPDLSNLVHRDYASVLKDIREPNAALNPDHVAYNVTLADGDVLTGVIVSDTAEAIVLADASAQPRTLSKKQIKEIKPSALSLMPEGLADALDAQGLKDLMTFMLTRPLEPAPIERDGAPPPRKLSEISALLKKETAASSSVKPLRLLLSAGPKDHGPGEHDYPLWQQRWQKLLSLAENVRVSACQGFPTPEQFQGNDVVIFYSNNPGWNAERARQLDAFLERGGGLVYLHYAVDGHGAADALAERIGLAWKGGASRFRHGPLKLDIVDARHPITRGISRPEFVDESYWQLIGDPARIHPLAHCMEDNKKQPLLWSREQGRGRVFVSIPGHYNWTFDDPLFRLLVLRGICWTAGEPVDRLSELATVGARVSE